MSDGRSQDRKRPRSVRELMAEEAVRRPPPARGTSERAEPKRLDAHEPVTVRRFSDGAEEWVARISGACVYGTGPVGTAPVVSISFARADSPEETLRVALSTPNTLECASDRELRRLLERARPVDEESA